MAHPALTHSIGGAAVISCTWTTPETWILQLLLQGRDYSVVGVGVRDSVEHGHDDPPLPQRHGVALNQPEFLLRLGQSDFWR
ncbi:Hypothetical predicted protein [Olea europaea subsp. europaea]|uniref:Uncharacterized protein n=1 Tax=Olea europaea subsp. europaea TaxID=158383 RepID=A0A8S0P9H4_OLEEU|nr:Hypothetical predicted protein [Olea europaea subsp. europaea]